jgi:hypothetical protein
MMRVVEQRDQRAHLLEREVELAAASNERQPLHIVTRVR